MYVGTRSKCYPWLMLWDFTKSHRVYALWESYLLLCIMYRSIGSYGPPHSRFNWLTGLGLSDRHAVAERVWSHLSAFTISHRLRDLEVEYFFRHTLFDLGVSDRRAPPRSMSCRPEAYILSSVFRLFSLCGSILIFVIVFFVTVPIFSWSLSFCLSVAILFFELSLGQPGKGWNRVGHEVIFAAGTEMKRRRIK